MNSNPATTPTGIDVDRQAGRVVLDWTDGHHTEYAAEQLRRICPCAFCQGEAGAPGWLASGPKLTEAQTRISGASLVGTYALAPTWADGHDTGYYTFEMLRAACPCLICEAERAGGA